MARINHCRTVSDAELKRVSRPVGSLVGGDYDKLWKDVERELREQAVRDARAAEACRHELIFRSI